MNQGAIQQEIVQNDNEHTKGEIIGRGMGGDGPFLSTWCRFKSSHRSELSQNTDQLPGDFFLGLLLNGDVTPE